MVDMPWRHLTSSCGMLTPFVSPPVPLAEIHSTCWNQVEWRSLIEIKALSNTPGIITSRRFCPLRRLPRLLMLSVLKMRPRSVAHFGLQCSSWSIMSRGSTLRTFLAPSGDVSKLGVRQANCMVSRRFGFNCQSVKGQIHLCRFGILLLMSSGTPPPEPLSLCSIFLSPRMIQINKTYNLAHAAELYVCRPVMQFTQTPFPAPKLWFDRPPFWAPKLGSVNTGFLLL